MYLRSNLIMKSKLLITATPILKTGVAEGAAATSRSPIPLIPLMVTLHTNPNGVVLKVVEVKTIHNEAAHLLHHLLIHLPPLLLLLSRGVRSFESSVTNQGILLMIASNWII